jgi:hypothetical protein
MPRRPAGYPGGACVHQRRPAIAEATSGRTRRPRPRSPSRVNGLWLRIRSEAPSSSLRFSRPPATRSARPLYARPFSGRVASWRRRELLPCHRPSRDSTCPDSPRLRSPLLTERGCASGAVAPSLEPREAPVPVRDDRPPATAASASREAAAALHTGEAPRREVIVPSAHAPSSCELTAARCSRSPPNGAASTPSSSSADHREWVVPGALSADLGVPPPPETSPPRAMAFRQVPSTSERARGRSRSRSSPYRILPRVPSFARRFLPRVSPRPSPPGEQKSDASFTSDPARP